MTADKNTVANRKVICDVLLEHAKMDKQITVLCSDSRGSASMTPFADAYPDQFVEMGISEQDLVSVAAGMAHCGKKPYAFSPACFLSTRSYEQCKIDVAYSHTNVKLIGISGGISYGALGMSHHSVQDIAAMSAIPGMRVYLPSDRFQTKKLMEHLLQDKEPAYVRVGRNPVGDIYDEKNFPFTMDQAVILQEGSDVTLIACGEMVKKAVDAAEILAKEGFVVLPYMNPDLNVARDLQNAGAACVMPLASPIGSNNGLSTKAFIQILIDEIDLPIIVDAGIGKPSQACEAMEMGAAAVMANTAIATAGDVPAMAGAFKAAIEGGRSAYLSGLGRVLERGASASDPLTGFLRD